MALLWFVTFFMIQTLTLAWKWSKKNANLELKLILLMHCVKSVHIRSYSGPHFSAFELNTERYGVSFPNQSECDKMPTRITPNTDTFYAVMMLTCNWHFPSFRVWGHQIWKNHYTWNIKLIKMAYVKSDGESVVSVVLILYLTSQYI